jgi:hypothetical protein
MAIAPLRLSAIVLVAATCAAPAARADSDRIGIALDGSTLGSTQTSTPGSCKAQCRNLPGCTGYNYALDGLGGEIILGGATEEKPLFDKRGAIANCAFLAGPLQDVADKGVVSCRMPCTDEAEDPAVRTDLDPKQGPAVEENEKVQKDGEEFVLRDPNQLAVEKDRAKGAEAAAPEVPPPTPAPEPPPPPEPPQQEPAQPEPQPAVAPAVPLSGYEVSEGPEFTIPPLGLIDATASCATQGKVAIGGGFVLSTSDPGGRFGLELLGLMPDGANGGDVRGKFRNANVVLEATGHVIAICINPVPGLRNADGDYEFARCESGERVIGGGFVGSVARQVPLASEPSGNGWRLILLDPIASNNPKAVRSVCAPEASVVQWIQPHRSSPIGLSARGVGTPQLRCPAGTVMLAPGFHLLTQARSFADAALVTRLAPHQGSTTEWRAEVRNRDVFGAPGSVTAQVSAICAAVPQ